MSNHASSSDVVFDAHLAGLFSASDSIADKLTLLSSLKNNLVAETVAIDAERLQLDKHSDKVSTVLTNLSVIETYPPPASSGGGIPVPKTSYTTTNDSVNGPFTGTNQYRTINTTTQGGTISIEFDNTANGSDFVFNTGSGHIMYITVANNLILANSVVAVTLHSVSVSDNDPDLYIHRIIDGEGGRVKLVVRFNKIWTISALSTETFNLNYVIL